MNEKSRIDVVDKYISEWALPNELIASWVKWTPEASLEKVVLKYEADVFIPRFLNIDEKVFEQDISSGEITIPVNYIQIPGFFGFHAIYTTIPNAERTLEFVLEFISDSKLLHTERFQTKIVRPILKCISEPSAIVIDANQPSLNAINISVVSEGSVSPANASITFSFNTTADLKLNLSYDKVLEKTKETVTEHVHINNLTIKGKGKAILKLSLEYTDNRKNKYVSPLTTITLDVRQKVREEIRFNGLHEPDEFPLLLAA